MTDISIHVPVSSLLKWWKCLETGLDISAETFDALTRHFQKRFKPWLKSEHHAQLNRNKDATLMDIYDTATRTGMDIVAQVYSVLMNTFSSISC